MVCALDVWSNLFVCSFKQEMWEKKKAAEELEREREAREKERLESLKKKGKHEESAVASEEVKQRLQVRSFSILELGIRIKYT